MEYDGIAAKRRKKRKNSSVYAPFVPSCGYSPLPNWAWFWTAKWEKPSGVVEYWSDGFVAELGKKIT